MCHIKQYIFIQISNASPFNDDKYSNLYMFELIRHDF